MAYKPKNNAKSTLASGISDVDTSIVVASGDGNLKFPTLAAGDYFHAYLINTSNQYEIVKVTARSADTMTVTRAQQGTSAMSFSTGDAFALRYTAADIDENVIRADAQDGKPNYLGSLSGTNTLTASATPTATAYTAGQRWTGKAAADNTGAVTLNVDTLGAKDVKDVDGNALKAGDIQQDAVHEFLYTGVHFVLVNPSGVRKSGDTMTGAIVLSNDSAFDLTAVAIPECGRFEYVSATKGRLNPCRGNRIAVKTAAGRWQLSKIPSAGVDINTTDAVWGGVTAAVSTLYYVYAYDSSGTLTLEASTTAYATDTDTGVEIKSGDATRRLVGLVITDASSQILYDLTPASGSQAYCNIISRLNRRGISLRNAYSTNPRTRNSTSAGTINSEIRINFVSWGDEATRIAFSGRVYNSSAAGLSYAYIAIDATEYTQVGGESTNTNDQLPIASSLDRLLSEGSHTADVYGSNSSGDPANYILTASNAFNVVVVG